MKIRTRVVTLRCFCHFAIFESNHQIYILSPNISLTEFHKSRLLVDFHRMLKNSAEAAELQGLRHRTSSNHHRWSKAITLSQAPEGTKRSTSETSLCGAHLVTLTQKSIEICNIDFCKKHVRDCQGTSMSNVKESLKVKWNIDCQAAPPVGLANLVPLAH